MPTTFAFIELVGNRRDIGWWRTAVAVADRAVGNEVPVGGLFLALNHGADGPVLSWFDRAPTLTRR